ncbi:MAG: DNA-binding protein AraC-type [Herbinix sp.]|jgi:AraC-like DNA-binding protein|nr:DNA-binding protein AraC-type [Herbinix sp.]
MKTYSIPFYDNSKKNELYCSYVEGLTFPPHFHEQVELLYVIDGEIEITINGVTEKLISNETAVIFPHKIHDFNTPIGSKVHLIIFPTSLLNDFYSVFHEMHPVFPYLKKEAVSKKITGNVLALFEFITTLKVDSDQSRYDFTFQNNKELWMAKGYLQLLLCNVFLLMDLVENKNAIEEDSVLKCIRYVTDHYLDSIQLADISNYAGISRVQVSRIFSGKIGYSFPEYLYTLRLNHAVHLLQTSDLSILDISNESGFEAISTFYYYFKKNYKISPNEYRRLYLIG